MYFISDPFVMRNYMLKEVVAVFIRKQWLVALTAVVLVCHIPARSQMLIGTQGLMNIPSAEMNPAGTFDGGVSLLQKRMMVDANDYYTGLYYISFTPFSFVEVTFRETLRKTRKSATNPKMGYYQQDRSTTLRLRPVMEKEGRWWPSVVVGVNDIYSDHGASEYAAVYGAVSKTVRLGGIMNVGATLGYAHPIDKGVAYDGVFGGISVSPASFDNLKIMAEYDTRGVNVGASVMLFRHLRAMCLTRDFEGVCGSLSYLYTIKY